MYLQVLVYISFIGVNWIEYYCDLCLFVLNIIVDLDQYILSSELRYLVEGQCVFIV